MKLDGIDAANAAVDYFTRTLPGQARGYIGTRDLGHALLPALADTGRAAGAAYQEFARFLGTTFPEDATDRFAIGEREYDWRVHNNLREPRTAAQLWDYGAEQVALYRAQMIEVAARVAKEAGRTRTRCHGGSKRSSAPGRACHANSSAADTGIRLRYSKVGISALC